MHHTVLFEVDILEDGLKGNEFGHIRPQHPDDGGRYARSTVTDGLLYPLDLCDVYLDSRKAGIHAQVVVLDSLLISSGLRKHGFGKAIVEYAVKQFNESLIVGFVGMMDCEEASDNTQSREEFETWLEKLSRFHEKCGFVNIQEYYDMEQVIPVVYPNGEGVRFIEHLKVKQAKLEGALKDAVSN
ncbi:hypothetical protein AGMMS49975_11240 [Clostridia bacterium]|nr:hypothetical protein AGMMS49975_11240 [Clostridia bacterium]